MILWCCYCQKLLGEKPPLTSFEMSHGICPRCDARLEAGEEILAEYQAALGLFRDLFAAASKGDSSTCAALAKRAYATGLGTTEILVGLVQPALVEIGTLWESGAVTVADEHRFTRWCETMMAILESPPVRVDAPLDILIVLAPGNRHDLGARMAEQALRAAGIHAEAIVPELPVSDIHRIAKERGASWIGFSCALPSTIDDARKIAREIADAGYRGRFLVAGQAVRRAPDAWGDLDIAACLTIDDARALIASSTA